MVEGIKRDYANLLEVLNKFRVRSTENWLEAYAENYSNRIIGYTVVYTCNTVYCKSKSILNL